jgi:hypothetical protein
MNIHYHDGCYGGYYTIDDKELKDFTEEEKKNLWLRLVNHLRLNPKMEELKELLSFVMNGYGTFDCAEEPCPTCGHWEDDIDFNM